MRQKTKFTTTVAALPLMTIMGATGTIIKMDYIVYHRPTYKFKSVQDLVEEQWSSEI
jgi:hypothetical protein